MSKNNSFLFSLFFFAIAIAFFFILGLSYPSLGFRFALISCLVSSGLFYVVYLTDRYLRDQLNLRKDSLRKEKNIAEQDILQLTELRDSLVRKIHSYQRLEKFTQDLNNEISLEKLCDIIVDETFELFGAKGNTLLYLTNEHNRRLELKAAKQEAADDRIKEKTGDLFDEWVLRHNQPLLVASATSDFRFDPLRLRKELSRPVGSLVCVPLVTDSHSLGVLRIDSRMFESYGSDDLCLLTVVADIAKLSLENAFYFAHMRKLSIMDGLTGVYLRRYVIERLREEFQRAERDNDALSFLMMDLDHFKALNETYGHLGGDVILTKVARWLKDFFSSPGSVVARYGGEEFCVILPHTAKKDAFRLAETFRLSLQERSIAIRRQKVGVSVSVGVAASEGDGGSFEDLLRSADEALLKAKKEGRNRVCSF